MSQVQTIMMLTQGNTPGYTVTEYLENQIHANGGKFSMQFCNLSHDLRPTRLEFRFINGIPKDIIIMNIHIGCPETIHHYKENITALIKAHNGIYTLHFSLNAPPALQLNSIEFEL